MFELLVKLVKQAGFIVLPADTAPAELANHIRPGRLADCIIMVAQNNATALQNAEDVARSLTASSGAYEQKEYKPGGVRYAVEIPYFITYLH